MEGDLRKILDEFYAFLRYEKRNALNTYQSYYSDVKDWITFVEDQQNINMLNEIAWTDIRMYFVHLSMKNLSSASLQRKQSSIKQFFDFCVYKERLEKSPIKKFPKRRKPQRLPVSLKEEQTEAMFKEMEQSKDLDTKRLGDDLILEILFQTGMRVSELIQLKKKHINWEEKTVKVLGKGNKWRLIPIMNELLEKMNQYIQLKNEEAWEISDYLLTLKTGKPLYRQYVYRVVKSSLSHYSQDEYKGPHVLRHSFATQLLNAGADLLHIKELLGHEQLASTQIYTQVHIDRLKEIHQQSHPKS